MRSTYPPVNILVVDDNIGNLLVLRGTLEKEGVHIFTTHSARNVVDICTATSISIALIEANMPEISGFELLTMLKNNPLTEKIIVILMTGYSINTDDMVLGLYNGAVDYLFKPFEPHITVAKVDSLITLVNHQREIEEKNKELEIYQNELFKAMQTAKEATTLKENFLANMSHEIRTPLNAIIGITHLLKEAPVYPGQEEMLRLIDFSSKALLGIVNDILESSQMDAGKIKIVPEEMNIISLFRTVSNLTRPMANDKGLELDCQIDQNVPAIVIADSLRLNQILINLINNAIKFTATGRIDLSLNKLKKTNDHIQLEFRIKDTGAGISPAAIEQIFDRFEQLEDRTWQKFGGTGLGLSIVKRLVELMGGAINVESEVGSGTTFIFTKWYEFSEQVLPYPEAVAEPKVLSNFNNVVILLAEDNQINQFVAIRILKSWNVKVDVVENGLEAFERVKARNYDLVLMDTHMPLMNGIMATKKIREELNGAKRNIPIISFSASVIDHEKREAIAAGVNDFIEKPFDPKSLHHKISMFLKK